MLSIIDSGALSTKTLGTVRMLQQDYASGFTGKLAVAATTEDAWLAFYPADGSEPVAANAVGPAVAVVAGPAAAATR